MKAKPYPFLTFHNTQAVVSFILQVPYVHEISPDAHWTESYVTQSYSEYSEGEENIKISP
jgi:hypothetical protein